MAVHALHVMELVLKDAFEQDPLVTVNVTIQSVLIVLILAILRAPIVARHQIQMEQTQLRVVVTLAMVDQARL